MTTKTTFEKRAQTTVLIIFIALFTVLVTLANNTKDLYFNL